MDDLLFIFDTARLHRRHRVHVGHVPHISPFCKHLAAGKVQACQAQIQLAGFTVLAQMQSTRLL